MPSLLVGRVNFISWGLAGERLTCLVLTVSGTAKEEKGKEKHLDNCGSKQNCSFYDGFLLSSLNHFAI